jgi:cohesin complex subunit SA-1/2
VAEVVNMVLRAAGCDLRIDEDDVADPDNAPSRVAELQEEFQTVSLGLSASALCMLTAN